MRALFSLACLLVLATSANAETITGRATVIDGDTLEIHGKRIRLFGIDAPESAQLCKDAKGSRYRCGQRAANDLATFINRRPVECVEVDRDQYRRIVAVCTAGDVDLADWLVRKGLALDWPRYSSGGYADAQREAQRVKAGMWAGSMIAPWDYRRCVKTAGSPSGCS